MNHDFTFSGVNDALPALAQHLLLADEVGSRNGRCFELTNASVTLDEPLNREIIVEGRKANIAAQIFETVWVLAGRNDIRDLAHYLPRAPDFSDDGTTWRAGYGPRIRHWVTDLDDETGQTEVDQLKRVIEILREDPMSRRAVIGIWDPSVDLVPGKDIACNDLLVFSNRLGKLDLHVTVRSNDLVWGWSGINQFEWSVLLEIVAKAIGVGVGKIHFSIVSLHMYEQHWAKARGWANPPRLPFAVPTPRWNPNTEDFDALFDLFFDLEFEIRNGRPSGFFVDKFPEPMLQSWLRVLQWWWTGDHAFLKPLAGTALEYATHLAVQPPPRKNLLIKVAREKAELIARDLLYQGRAHEVRHALKQVESQRVTEVAPDRLEEFIALMQRPPTDPLQPEPEIRREFVLHVTDLHIQKDAAYGPSWKRRGQKYSILPNIARKVDRLGSGGETSDENQIDTAIDLLLYLVKYQTWIDDQKSGSLVLASDDAQAANQIVRYISGDGDWDKETRSDEDVVAEIQRMFENLLEAVESDRTQTRDALVSGMSRNAFSLAYWRWSSAEYAPDEYRGADAD